jgi:hypothetical protein
MPQQNRSKEDNMPILTLAAIEAHPSNAVDYALPATPDRTLLEAAYCAAVYCLNVNFLLMRAVRERRYVPPQWLADQAAESVCPDAHEYNEARWLKAVERVHLIAEQFEEAFGEPIVRLHA